MYSVSFQDVAITALQDLFSLVVAANKPVKLHSCFLSQTSELGDAAEEQLRIDIVRGNGTVGSGGTAPTIYKLNSNDAAASATARANDTTEASAGTEQIMHSEAFNVRAGWQYIPTPETRIITSSTDDIIAVRLLDVPGDEITMTGTLYFEEE
jgi:hypothetical protein